MAAPLPRDGTAAARQSTDDRREQLGARAGLTDHTNAMHSHVGGLDNDIATMDLRYLVRGISGDGC